MLIKQILILSLTTFCTSEVNASQAAINRDEKEKETTTQARTDQLNTLLETARSREKSFQQRLDALQKDLEEIMRPYFAALDAIDKKIAALPDNKNKAKQVETLEAQKEQLKKEYDLKKEPINALIAQYRKYLKETDGMRITLEHKLKTLSKETCAPEIPKQIVEKRAEKAPVIVPKEIKEALHDEDYNKVMEWIGKGPEKLTRYGLLVPLLERPLKYNNFHRVYFTWNIGKLSDEFLDEMIQAYQQIKLPPEPESLEQKYVERKKYVLEKFKEEKERRAERKEAERVIAEEKLIQKDVVTGNLKEFFEEPKGEQKIVHKIKKAIRKNDLKKLAVLIGKKNEYIELKDERGYTPLLQAVYTNKPKAVELLLKAGADRDATITAADGSKVNALELAKLLGHGAVIDELIKPQGESVKE